MSPNPSRRRTERRGLQLWPVGIVLTATFTMAVVVAAITFYAGWDLLGARKLKPEPSIDSKTLFDMVKLSFGVVAGAGALVALVVAYRRQRVDEAGALRESTRLHTERFTAAVTQLGDDSAAVRLGGVHALAGLADDAPTRALRQTGIDVLCAYLRLPYVAESDLPEGDEEARHTYLALREVRMTVIRLIRDHLRLPLQHQHSWQGHDFDLTEVTFDGGDLSGAQFSGGAVSFSGARFVSAQVRFDGALFTSGVVSFDWAEFCGHVVRFDGARFSGGEVTFDGAVFSGGEVRFDGARFSDGEVTFDGARFSGGEVRFDGARFSDGEVTFDGARFSDGEVTFDGAVFSGGEVTFDGAVFSGGEVRFDGARFSDGEVTFDGAVFSGGEVRFDGAVFSGGEVRFNRSEFSGATLGFIDPDGPAPFGVLSLGSPPPTGVMVPDEWLSDGPNTDSATPPTP